MLLQKGFLAEGRVYKCFGIEVFPRPPANWNLYLPSPLARLSSTILTADSLAVSGFAAASLTSFLMSSIRLNNHWRNTEILLVV